MKKRVGKEKYVRRVCSATFDGSRPPVWFALDETRPLAFFAGVWTNWTSVRKVREGETTNDLFAFLTTEPNAIVAPIHPKAMPVILRRQTDIEVWLTAPDADALTLQKPLPDNALRIVARGEKADPRPISDEAALPPLREPNDGSPM